MKRIFSVIILVGLIGFLAIFLFVRFSPESLEPLVVNQLISTRNEQNSFFDGSEDITVYTIGTAAPMPGDRVQTGTGIVVNNKFFLFDVGDGVVQQAETMNLPIQKIDAVFISHWHSDHFIDLPYLINRSWILGRDKVLNVYGPNGLEDILQASQQLIAIENQHRVKHHGEKLMNLENVKTRGFPILLGGDESKLIYNNEGIKITAFLVNHHPLTPAFGFCIEYNGKKVVLSGDTKKNENLIAFAKNADILIHEVLLPSFLTEVSKQIKESGDDRAAQIVSEIAEYHTSPKEIAEIAKICKPKKIVLNHFVPLPDYKVIEFIYRNELKGIDNVYLSNDGDKYLVN